MIVHFFLKCRIFSARPFFPPFDNFPLFVFESSKYPAIHVRQSNSFKARGGLLPPTFIRKPTILKKLVVFFLITTKTYSDFFCVWFILFGRNILLYLLSGRLSWRHLSPVFVFFFGLQGLIALVFAKLVSHYTICYIIILSLLGKWKNDCGQFSVEGRL